MMKTVFVLTAMLLLLFIACDRGPQAPFDPEDQVVIHGRYFDADGNAYSTRWIGYWINSPESFFTNYFGFDPEESTQTDENGNYSEDFMGEDLMDAGGATFKIGVMNYDTNFPDTIPHVLTYFYPLDVDIEVPDVTLWDGNPSVSFSSSDVTFSWDPRSDLSIELSDYVFRMRATQDGPAFNLWVENTGTNTSLTLPAYVLPEVYIEKWRVIAHYAAPSDNDFGYYYMTRPDTTPIPDDPYALLSLGANCYAEAYPDTFRNATDGKWGPWPIGCVSFLATNVSWIYVDLGASDTVNAVVMYGLGTTGTAANEGYEVYVADDTVNWGTPVAEISEMDDYFYLDGFTAEGRYVKLEAKDAGIGITGFREFCIFGPQ
jgi:hypothetical protein